MPWIHERRQDSSLPIADETYYLDGEGNVTIDSKDAAIQLVAKGSPISKEIQEKYGIGKKAKAADKAAEAEEVDGGEKASRPSANKAAKPKSNKGAK